MTERKFGIFREVFLVENDFFLCANHRLGSLRKEKKIDKKIC